MSFNLSEWALKSRSVVIYLMIVAVAAGVFAFVKLGRNEDPAFVIKSMVVVAAWPGATMEDTLSQVTERLERQIEETPGLDFRPQLHHAGPHDDLRHLKQDVPGSCRPGNLVQGPATSSPTSARRCRPVLWGPVFNDRSATPSASSTASPPTVQPGASCATMSRRPARGCCSSPTSRRSRS